VRQSGVNASKWILPTIIVSNIDFTHFLLPCLKDKKKMVRLPHFTRGFRLVLLGKSQRPQWKTNDSFTDKITNEKITALYTLQLLFPLPYLSSLFLCNQQQYQRLATHCGLQISLQAGCLSSKVEYAAGMPGRLVRAPEFTQFPSWGDNGYAVVGVRRELNRAKTFQFKQDSLLLGPATHLKP